MFVVSGEAWRKEFLTRKDFSLQEGYRILAGGVSVCTLLVILVSDLNMSRSMNPPRLNPPTREGKPPGKWSVVILNLGCWPLS